MEFSRPEHWSGSLFLPQGIFPTQGSNPGLWHCRWIPYQLSSREAQEYWSGYSLSLLQWIFLTQELNWGLLHCRWILYQLSYEGSPQMKAPDERITEYNDESLLCLVGFTEEVVFELSLENTIHPPSIHPSIYPSSIHPGLFRCLLSSFYRPDILKSIENTETISAFKNVTVKSDKDKDFLGGPVVKARTFCAFTMGGTGSIPGWGTKTLHDAWRGQK